MKGIDTVELIATELQRIKFPIITRPRVGPRDPATEELIEWGTQFYAYSVTAHLRKTLGGLILLAHAENVPVANIVGRHILEWTAHACYMNENLKNFRQDDDWEAAWKLLTVATQGNLWVNRYGNNYAPAQYLPLEVPDPFRVGEVVSAYEAYQAAEYGVKQAKDSYSFLSEYSHPNAACLEQYHKYLPNGRDVEIAEEEPVSGLPVVNWCLIDVLRFIHSLLDLSNEQAIRPNILQALTKIAKRAPAKMA